MVKLDIVREATHLTRAGQLAKAPVLLQRMLRDEAAPEPTSVTTGAAASRMNFIAEEQSCFVVYPEQRSEANQAKCWNWFRTADQQRERGEPSLIAGITRQIMCDYSVDSKRVYVGGLSAGAAAAAIMGATYNDLYAAIGIHSGLACGAAVDLPSAFVAMRQGGGSDDRVIPGDGPPVPTIGFHAGPDVSVHPNNGDKILEQFMRTTSTQKKVHR